LVKSINRCAVRGEANPSLSAFTFSHGKLLMPRRFSSLARAASFGPAHRSGSPSLVRMAGKYRLHPGQHSQAGQIGARRLSIEIGKEFGQIILMISTRACGGA